MGEKQPKVLKELVVQLKESKLNKRQFVQAATELGLRPGAAFSLADETLGRDYEPVVKGEGAPIQIRTESGFLRDVLGFDHDFDLDFDPPIIGGTRAYNRFSRAYNRFSRAYNRFSRAYNRFSRAYNRFSR